ncbi:transposase [Yersinia intermedia]|nr:transposase [Yersinia intermedia]CNH39780.1 transposase [Yersinia intermedia]
MKVKGQWNYLYRALNTSGQTIGFLLTAKRDAIDALRVFRNAIRRHDDPDIVTLDKSGANTEALTTLNADKPEEEIITVR